MANKYIYGVVVIVTIVVFFMAYYYVQNQSSQSYTAVTPILVDNVATTTHATASQTMFKYIEVTDGCDPHFVGGCVNIRSGPGVTYPVVVRLRTGAVLKVGEKILDKDGNEWYTIVFSTELLYPERVKGDWYVAAQFVRAFSDDGDRVLEKGNHATSTKRIVVDVSEQKLYAYDGDVLFMEELISTGLEFTPTPRGTFTIFKMTPSRFMQGPIPGVSDQVYDLPGVPWNMYFTTDGAVIHGTYWHDHFGEPWSHGCVNLSPATAKKLYDWATVGVQVVIKK